MNLEEKTLNKEYVFKGKIINVRVDSVKLPNDSVSTREIVEHNGGIAILPIDDDNNAYLVKQWRCPYQKVVSEIPAGKREGNEDVLEGGIREVTEEIGATAESIVSLGKLYPTPGYCGEVIYMFLARKLKFSSQNLDEDEFLNVEKIPFDKLVEMVVNGEICDAKTIAAVLKADKLIKGKEIL